MTHLEAKPLAAGFSFPARLSSLDYLFRGLSVVGLLEGVALVYNLALHPHMPGIVGQSFALRIFGGLMGSCFLLVGALVVWRIPGNAAGRFLILLGLMGLGAQFDYKLASPILSVLALEGLVIYVGGIGIPSLMYLMLYFPTGKIYPPHIAHLVGIFAALKVVGALLEVMASPSHIAFFTLLPFNPLLIPWLVPYRGLIAATIGITGIMLPLGLLGGLFSLVQRYRASSPSERQQIKWMVWAFSLMVLVLPIAIYLLLNHPTGPWQTLAFAVGLSALINFFLCIAVSVLRYGLWEMYLILNRTLVYGALSTFVVGTYVLVVGYFGQMFQHSGNVVLSLLAIGLIAVLFQPLRHHLQRSVNRLLYGQRDEPYAVLSKLGERLEGNLPSGHLLMVLVQTLTQVLRLPYAAVWLEGQVFAYGISRGDSLSVPLLHQGERLGELLVSPRSPSEPFSPGELKLLSDIAHQAGLAAQTVRLSAELQRSRSELVLAAEEERKRLRHDLHDGLGPALAGLALKLEAARERIRTEPTEATALLTTVEGQVQGLMAEIRRLVQNLRPPALDELGLAGALHRLVDQCGLPGLEVRLEVASPLPSLPAAVEVAAYRIAQEALTNAVRHARATICTLRLTVNHELLLSLEDDGIGLTRHYRAGVGLKSMAERAQTLGGSLEVGPGSHGGTRLVARIPLGGGDGAHSLVDRG